MRDGVEIVIDVASEALQLTGKLTMFLLESNRKFITVMTGAITSFVLALGLANSHNIKQHEFGVESVTIATIVEARADKHNNEKREQKHRCENRYALPSYGFATDDPLRAFRRIKKKEMEERIRKPLNVRF
ncbi:MAG: hypothetical protein Q7S22_07390 [Candidatus Micrarchaeota archaeon]|nr:hypothetical protein [Candidatus Micrarchaeota archaeon]